MGGSWLRGLVTALLVVGMAAVAAMFWGQAREISLAALAAAVLAPILNWRVGRLDAELKAQGLQGLDAPEGSRPSALEETLKWGFLSLLVCLMIWLAASVLVSR